MDRRGFFGGVIGAILAWLGWGLAAPAPVVRMMGQPMTLDWSWFRPPGLLWTEVTGDTRLLSGGRTYLRWSGKFEVKDRLKASDVPTPPLAPGFRRKVLMFWKDEFKNIWTFDVIDHEIKPPLS